MPWHCSVGPQTRSWESGGSDSTSVNHAVAAELLHGAPTDRVGRLAGRDPTAWLGMRDSNSEMSPQIIPLKGRKICGDLVELWPQRLFAFELRRWENAAPASCWRDLQQALCADVVHRGGIAVRHELAAISADPKMIRRRQNQQYYCSACAGLLSQRERRKLSF
jgi:hypothetical protein